MQILRLTTPKLKEFGAPFAQDDKSFYVMDFRDRTLAELAALRACLQS